MSHNVKKHMEEHMEQTHSTLITDQGIVTKRDSVGMIFSWVSALVILILLVLGVLAFLF